MKFILFLVITIGVIFGIITFQNNVEISVKFIKWSFSGHLALVLLVPFAAGLLAGISALISPVWKKSAQARHLKKRVQELEDETSQETEEVEQVAHETETEQPAEVTPEVLEPEKKIL
jgi:uncharacterized integral membrane protein